jgi:putative ABC transport system permease protein
VIMRLYRLLLRLCPAPFRQAYGDGMEETFACRLADARAAGQSRQLRVWLREVLGLIAVVVTERWHSVRGGRTAADGERRAGRMDRFGQELRHAARRLTRSPGFTLTAVATLALAIGANAAIFAVVQHVVLNPLPYPRSDRLIELDHGSVGLRVSSGLGNTPGLYFHYAEQSHVLDAAALYRTVDRTISGDGDPERIRVTRSTPSLASAMRVEPVIGRWFLSGEGKPGTPPVAVLSHALWARRYNGDPGVLGRSISLDGVATEIVGVMPAGYAFPEPTVEAWVAEPLARSMGFGLWNYSGVARLRDGVTLDAARAELTGLIPGVTAAFPGDPGAVGNVDTKLLFTGRSLKDATIGNITRALWMLMAAVGVVLLVACANVANLFLVRSEARQREVAVRRALGATRLGIARFFLTESILLSMAGGICGFAIAAVAVRLLLTFGPATLPRLHELRLDAVTVSFTAAVSLFAALACGALPLWRVVPFAQSLHEVGRGTTASRGSHRARHLLMGAQVALALVLLVASGLMVRSLQNLRAIDPGFDAPSALTFRIGLPNRAYPSLAAVVGAHHAALDRLAAMPGVVSASATSCLPLAGGCSGNTIRIEGRTYPPGTVPPLALFRAVAGGYFETIGTRILRGRGITRGDVDRAEPVVVVNETIAKKFFAGEDPIGRHLASNRPPPRLGHAADLTWLTIVGIAADVPTFALAGPRANALPLLYMPMSLATGPGAQGAGAIGPDATVMSYVVRTATPPQSLLPMVRLAIDEVDRSLAIAQVRTLQEILDGAGAQMAFTMVLLAIAASVALTLGTIGIYGVMSYIVSQRTGEIGVRLALGADPGSVAGMIAREGGLVALAGAAIGLGVAFAGGRLIESLLYDISPRDPRVFAVTTAVLILVALAACWLPARRAARLSPMEALRTE